MVSKGLLVVAAATLGVAAGAMAQDGTTNEFATGYNAGIWVDPDGCEHWVMDGGIEGWMSPHLDRDGNPVCRLVLSCDRANVFGSDTLFEFDRAVVRPEFAQQLRGAFATAAAQGISVAIEGHTDSIGSAAYNQGLSVRRAEAVAAIAREAGVTAQVAGAGESEPVASNATDAGRAQNRRVEITCL